MAKRVYVAGHRGMVGSALLRRLADEPNLEILTARHEMLDLLERDATFAFVRARKPDWVGLLASVSTTGSSRRTPGTFEA